jgi:rare lipoprotein A
MHIRRKTSKVNPNGSLQFWLLVGASCAALTGAMLTLPARAVLANALLPHPAANAPVASSATPASLAPQPDAEKDKLHGIASWYGSVFNGRRTASGERFNMYAMTACHPTLPFGTRVRVINRSNHKSVVVRITDRGELVKGRIIDLSYEAAKKLAMTKDGLAAVDLQVISRGGIDQKK